MNTSDPLQLPDEGEPRDPSELSTLIPRLYRRAAQPTNLFATPFVVTYEEPGGLRGDLIGGSYGDPQEGNRLHFYPAEVVAHLRLPDHWYLVAYQGGPASGSQPLVIMDDKRQTIYYTGPWWLMNVRRTVDRLTGMICEPCGSLMDWINDGRITFRARQRGY